MDFLQLSPEHRLEATLSVLSAMVTPVVLISACGTLLISTGNRLGRAIDRTRKVVEIFRRLTENPEPDDPDWQEEVTSLYGQLAEATGRTRLLHSSLSSLYVAQASFVATSVALGVITLSGNRNTWVPLLFGMTGVALLFQAILCLIGEMRANRRQLGLELDFIVNMSKRHAPPSLQGVVEEAADEVRA